MAAGRPTIYDPIKTIAAAEAYLASCEKDDIEEFHKHRTGKKGIGSFDRILHVNLPTLEGLALHLKVNRDTIYSWKDDPTKPDFSDICERLLLLQAQKLQKGAVSGQYNASVSTMLLARQGIKAVQEVEVSMPKELQEAITKIGQVLK